MECKTWTVNYSSVRLYNVQTYGKENIKGHYKVILRISCFMINCSMGLESPYKRMLTGDLPILEKVGLDWAPLMQSQQIVTESLETSSIHTTYREAAATAEHTPTCLKLPQASLSRFYDASEMKFYCILPPPHQKPKGWGELGKENRTHQEEQADLSEVGNWLLQKQQESKVQKT
jgi:hypothetical protein